MNIGTPPTIKPPCAAWANALAAGPGDLSATERAALDAHVATCEACAAVRADYARMDTLLRDLPAPAVLASLPTELLALQREAEAGVVTHEMDGAEVLKAHSRTLPLRPQRHPPPRPAAFGAIAAVLIVSVVVAGFAALLSHRQYGPGVTTGFNGDFGPPVLPTGPQPQVGSWRQISLPDGVPTQSSGHFGVTPQTSVPDLVYGCYQAVSNPEAPEPRKLWRSEDGGRSWSALNAPAGASPQQEGCYIEVSPGAPDELFLNGNAGGESYYSLDRGDHWQVLQQPAGAELWDVAAPKVEGAVWYYIRTVGVSQPEIWVSRDHGAQWVKHLYPVRVPPSLRDDGTYPGVVPLLLRYEKGGLLFLFERTLWWSPDYGATWQRLETWSGPPCDRGIIGTPDLSVLYCVAWNGEQKSQPYWRSLNHGQTWTPIPAEPPATPAANGLAFPRITPPLILRDGSLFELASIPGDTNTVAFYSLAPNANVWMQASAPLNEILGLCPDSTPGAASGTICAQLNATLADGPTGKQFLYLTRSTQFLAFLAVGGSGGESMVGEITWK
jgi:Putative zinc-finger